MPDALDPAREAKLRHLIAGSLSSFGAHYPALSVTAGAENAQPTWGDLAALLAERDAYRAALLDRVRGERGCTLIECTDQRSEHCMCWEDLHRIAGLRRDA